MGTYNISIKEMKMTKEQALANIVAVVKQFRGLTIDEAEVIKQSLEIISGIINKPETEK